MAFWCCFKNNKSKFQRKMVPGPEAYNLSTMYVLHVGSIRRNFISTSPIATLEKLPNEWNFVFSFRFFPYSVKCIYQIHCYMEVGNIYFVWSFIEWVVTFLIQGDDFGVTMTTIYGIQSTNRCFGSMIILNWMLCRSRKSSTRLNKEERKIWAAKE